MIPKYQTPINLKTNLTKTVNKLNNKDFDGEIKLSIYDIKTASSFDINGDSSGWAASIIKFPIMIAAMKEISNNNLNLEEKLIVDHKFTLERTDMISCIPNGALIPLPELVCEMIVNSDNEATNMIANRIGIETINNFMWDINMNNSMLGHLLCPKVPRYSSEFNKDGSNITTPNDMVKALRQVYDSKCSKLDANTRTLSDYFFKYTERNKIKFKIGFISDDDYGDDVHEVGIIEDRLIYAIMINKVGQKAIKKNKIHFNRIYEDYEDRITTVERKFQKVNNITDMPNYNRKKLIINTQTETNINNSCNNRQFNVFLDKVAFEPITEKQYNLFISPAKKVHYIIKDILREYIYNSP